MMQILLNLLSNAIKFSKENETIYVNVRYTNSCANNSNEYTIYIEVLDYGIGITESD